MIRHVLLAALLLLMSSAQGAGPLRINEIQYNPPPSLADAEFVEIHNPGNASVDLRGWRLADGVTFSFPDSASISAGGFAVVARDPEALRRASGQPALGPFSKKLSNGGERLALLDPEGKLSDEVTYGTLGTWPSGADGTSGSLELLHPAMPGGFGDSWAVSAQPLGSPGAPNSRLLAAPRATIAEVLHSPVRPQPNEALRITARILNAREATLLWSADGSGQWQEIPMTMAADGTAGAAVPGLADGARLLYRIRSGDATTPADGDGYVVQFRGGSAEGYDIVLSARGEAQLRSRDVKSNDLIPCTFIDDRGRLYNGAGLRLRGNTSRNLPQKHYRVELPPGATLADGTAHINLFAGYLLTRVTLGYDLLRRAGFPASATRPVRLWMNGRDMGSYLQIDAIDSRFLTRNFPGDDTGNLYKGISRADFWYLGEDISAYLPYFEQKSGADESMEDVLRMSRAMLDYTDPQYEAFIRGHVDIQNWARFFALHMIFNNQEGGVYRDYGDDYSVYFRPSDGRAMLLVWDLDGIWEGPQETIWRTTSPPINRFLRSNAFAPYFLAEIKNLLDGEFSQEAMGRAIAALGPEYPEEEKRRIAEFIAARHASIRKELSTQLTIDGLSTYDRRTLIPHDAEWRLFRGRTEPSGPKSTEWTTLPFDDSRWESAHGAVGGWLNLADTILNDHRGQYRSFYLRRKFTADGQQLGEETRLVLRANYDDGFLAHLNGKEVARVLILPHLSFVSHDIGAYMVHEPRGYEEFDLGRARDVLAPGDNILALQTHSLPWGESNILMDAELVLRDPAPAQPLSGNRVTVQRRLLELAGWLDQTRTFAVRVNGQNARHSAYAGTWDHQVELSPGSNMIVVQALDEKSRVIEEVQREVVFESPAHLQIQGTLDTPTTFTHHLVKVIGDLTVPAGVTLGAEPGTTIQFAPGARLLGAGEVRFVGTAESPILLEPAKDADSWGGIHFAGENAKVRLEHVTLRRGSLHVSQGAEALVDHSTLEDSAGAAITADGSPDPNGRTIRLIAPTRFVYGRTSTVRVDLLDRRGDTERYTNDTRATLTATRTDTGEPIVVQPAEFDVIAGAGACTFTLNLADREEATTVTLTVSVNGRTATRQTVGVHYDILKNPRMEWRLAPSQLDWKKEDGIMAVNSMNILPEGTPLVIHPGTLVMLTAGSRINAMGDVIARGTEEEPIYFFSENPAHQWEQIFHFGLHGKSIYEHVIFAGAGAATTLGHAAGPAIAFSAGDLVLNEVTMSDFAGKALWTGPEVNSVNIRRSLFNRLVHGGEAIGFTVNVEDSHFLHMHGADDADGFYIIGSENNHTFRRNTIAFVDDDGMDTAFSDIVMEDTIIRNAQDKGISYTSQDVTLRNCLIRSSTFGVVYAPWLGGVRGTMEATTVTDWKAAGVWYRFDPRKPVEDGAWLDFSDSVIWGGTGPSIRNELDKTRFDIWNSTFSAPVDVPMEGNANRNIDPKFVDRGGSAVQATGPTTTQLGGPIGFRPLPRPTITIRDTRILRSAGDALSVTNSAFAQIDNVLMVANEQGIALSAKSLARARNTTIADSRTHGIRMGDQAWLSMTRSILVGNKIADSRSNARWDLSRTIVWPADAAYPGRDNLKVEPRFADPAAGNYNPALGTPAAAQGLGARLP